MTKNFPVLKIKIQNKDDVELLEFADAMRSIDDQYNRFVTQKKRRSSRADCKLFVHKVSHGSIIIDLCERAPEVFPVIAPLIVEYSSFVTKTIDYLCGRVAKLPSYYKYLKEDFLNFKKLLEPIANVTGNNLNFTGVNFGTTIVINNNYTHTEALAAQNQADREIKKLEKSGDSLLKEKVALKLYQARNSALSQSTRGNLGIVEDVAGKPKPLSFANDRLRYDVTKAEENPLNFYYLVDLEIKLKEGSLFLDTHHDIKEYEVLKLWGPIEEATLLNSHKPKKNRRARSK